MAVATVAHSPTESSFCASIVANRSFDLARNGHLAMEGFPNFKQAVQDLKNVEPPPQPEYSVCFAMNDSLVIKEAIIDQWMEKPEFLQEMEKLVKSHNDEFNKKGLKRGSQTNGQSEDSRPAKRLCVSSDPTPLDQFETKHSDRHLADLSSNQIQNHQKPRHSDSMVVNNFFFFLVVLWSCLVNIRQDLTTGHWTLSFADDGIYIHSNEDYVVPLHEELCSFGSGDYVKEAEAKDVMSDIGGRWLVYDLSGPASDHFAILEHSRKLPEHLREQDWFNKVSWLFDTISFISVS